MASIRSEPLSPYVSVEGRVEHKGAYSAAGGDPTFTPGNPVVGGYVTAQMSENEVFQTEMELHEEVSEKRADMHLHEDQVAENPFTPLPKGGEREQTDDNGDKACAPHPPDAGSGEHERSPTSSSHPQMRGSESSPHSPMTARQRLRRATDSVKEGVKQASAHVAHAGEQVGWVWNKTLDRAMWVCAVAGTLAIALLGIAASLRTWRYQELSYFDANGINTSRVELGLEKMQRIQTLDRINDAGYVYMYDPPVLYKDALTSAYCVPNEGRPEGGMDELLALSEGMPVTGIASVPPGTEGTPPAAILLPEAAPEAAPEAEGASPPEGSLEGSEAPESKRESTAPTEARGGDTEGPEARAPEGESSSAAAPAEAAPEEGMAANERPEAEERGATAAPPHPAAATEGAPTEETPEATNRDAQRAGDAESTVPESSGERPDAEEHAEAKEPERQSFEGASQAGFMRRRLQGADLMTPRRQGPLANPPPFSVSFGRNPGTPGSLDPRFVEMREMLLGNTLFDIHCRDLTKFKNSGAVFIRLATAYVVFAGIGLLAAIVSIGLSPLKQRWAMRLKEMPLNLLGTVSWLVALVLQLCAIATWGLGTDVAACVTQEGGAGVCRLGPATVVAIGSLVFTLVAAITYTVYFAHKFIKDLGIEKKELEVREASGRRQLEMSQAANQESLPGNPEGPAEDDHRGFLVPPSAIPQTGPHPQAIGESNTPVRSITEDPSVCKHERKRVGTESPAPEEGRRSGTGSPAPNELKRSGTGSPAPNEMKRSRTGSPGPNEARESGTGSPDPIPTGYYL